MWADGIEPKNLIIGLIIYQLNTQYVIDPYFLYLFISQS